MINDTNNKQIGNDDFKKEGTPLRAKEVTEDRVAPKAKMHRFFFPVEGVNIEAESLPDAQKKLVDYKKDKTNK